jgi:hypothetical protein
MLPHLQADSLGGLAAAFEDLVLLSVGGAIVLVILVCLVCMCYRRGCCGLYSQPEDHFAHGLDRDELALQRALEDGGIELSGIDSSTTAATRAMHRNGIAQSASAQHSGQRTLGGKLKHAIKSRLDKLQRRARAQMYAPVGVSMASGAASPTIHSNVGSPRLALDQVEIDTTKLEEHEFFTDEDEEDVNEFETTSLSPTDDRSRTLHSHTHLPRLSPDSTAFRIASRSEAELLAALRGEAEEMQLHGLGGEDLEMNAQDLEQLEMLSASSAPPAAYTA